MTEEFEEVRRIFQAAPFIGSVGIELDAVSPGECHASLKVRPDHLQQTGVVHAGVIATLADHAAGGAAGSVLEKGSYPLSIEFKINFLHGASTGKLVCHAKVLRSGRNIVVAEAEVMAVTKNGGETLIAKAMVTLAVLQGQLV